MRRPRCRVLARLLHALAWRIYPESLMTIQVVRGDTTQTFVDCRHQEQDG